MITGISLIMALDYCPKILIFATQINLHIGGNMKDKSKQSMVLPLMVNDGRVLSLEGTLHVTDCLDGWPGPGPEFTVDNMVKCFPVKMMAACMVIVIKGSVTLSVNFRDFVATDNSCIIINEGTIVEKAAIDGGSRVIFLSFLQDELADPASAHRFYTSQVLLVGLQREHLEMMTTVYQMLRTILSDPSFATNRQASANSCLSLLNCIIVQALENQRETTATITRQEEIVARFLQCVADNYRTHRELSFYASQLSLSLKYMSHVVHAQTGRHPSQWIKDYVILDAKTMLRSGRYTVQQIADELNFPNQSFFGKYFKEAVGISPKKWK